MQLYRKRPLGASSVRGRVGRGTATHQFLGDLWDWVALQGQARLRQGASHWALAPSRQQAEPRVSRHLSGEGKTREKPRRELSTATPPHKQEDHSVGSEGGIRTHTTAVTGGLRGRVCEGGFTNCDLPYHFYEIFYKELKRHKEFCESSG